MLEEFLREDAYLLQNPDQYMACFVQDGRYFKYPMRSFEL
jgi:hypothetical protein